MHRRIFSTMFLLFVLFGIKAQSDESTIRRMLDDQTKAWNEGNLDLFMVGYWENDSLMYIGSGGITYGYAQTLSRYKTKYSDTAKMGKLTFTILKVQFLSPEYYFVTGKFYLKRTVGDASGQFTLLFRKINGVWRIVADHSS